MNVIILTISSLAVILSIMAFTFSVVCFIKVKATELSKYEFVPVDSKDLFETDIDKINKELEDEEIDEEIDNAFETNRKQINEVIL